MIVNPDSSEGQFLDLVSLQSDEPKRVALLEQFIQRFPRHPAVAWAWEQIEISALAASQWDKALQAGEKLLEINPDDLESAQYNAQAAGAKGDAVQARKWNAYAGKIAQHIVESPPPKDPEELEAWKKRVAAASQLTVQGDYGLYKRALDSADSREKVRLLDELSKRSPDSPYLAQANLLYLNAYRSLGDQHKSLVYAEKILEKDQNNEDALLVAAEAYLQRGVLTDRVLSYSASIIELMSTKKKPAGVPAGEWERKKNLYTGTAHWMAGNIFVNQRRFQQADSSLRAALPLLRSSEQSTAALLFYLGWANYNLENFTDAARFYRQCVAIHSQFQEQAQRNLGVLKNQHDIPESDPK